MSVKSIRISLIQTDIVWENKQSNLRLLHRKLQALRGTTEIVVLPEMFSTGFSMHTGQLAEPVCGETMQLLRQWAADYQLAICGSFMATENGQFFNRAFFLTPEGEAFFYDKRHLFRMGREGAFFTAGTERKIISYRGWKVCLLVCYDLRFPVWSRNTDEAFDLLIYVANWPASRRLAWDTLLRARAIENQCYVCGVNRIGTDGYQLCYNGGSALYSPLGEALLTIPDAEERTATAPLPAGELSRLRETFPVGKDADRFELKE